MRYEVLEHTADVMVRCRGKTLEECFENAAYALSDQTVDATKVEAKDMFSVDVTGGDDEERLYAFLSEILFLQDAEYYAFSEFRVTIDGDRVTAQIYGEPLDVKKHRAKTEVKAITYHMMKVDPSVPELTVVFDI
ncbi:MAG: archease [Candidatus Methanomethylophilaceae archaeon]|nr:archease [Candidatus Methanomethylophilaceae archaeon]